MNHKDSRKFLLAFFHVFNMTVALCVYVGWATVELRNAVDMKNCPPASLMGTLERVEKERESGEERSLWWHDIRCFLNSNHLVCSWDALHLSGRRVRSLNLMKHSEVKNKSFS